MTFRRFERRDKKRVIFWEIARDGDEGRTVTTRFGSTGPGETGAPGTWQRTYPTTVAAANASVDFVRAKERQTFVEIEQVADAPMAAPLRPTKGATLIDYATAVAWLKKQKLWARAKSWWPARFNMGALLFSGDVKMKKVRLDYRFAIDDAKGGQVPDGILVEGNLTVGILDNSEQDFGPFLVTRGSLDVKYAAVGGASILVGKDLKVREAFHGYYNHGLLRVEGKTTAKLFIVDDYYAELAGKVTGTIVSEFGTVKGKLPRKVKALDVLGPAWLAGERGDDPDEDDRYLDSEKLYAAISKGRPVRPRTRG